LVEHLILFLSILDCERFNSFGVHAENKRGKEGMWVKKVNHSNLPFYVIKSGYRQQLQEEGACVLSIFVAIPIQPWRSGSEKRGKGL
jgi:hypothetical protein